ncbi:hypothetical protein Tsubulata_045597 [Turnera subulata]|uniref:ABC transporter domain-containing protein n=1 Tax=Turnera subulata TaxID=218843 RepID=A0A9Q0GE56_9ROSI|nr:hypothetical protein Tsubulata_045597 [Turnera subulata]
MDGADDFYKASSILAGASSIWTNTATEVFPKSSQREDDERALKWAALEKLPTFKRLRTGLLITSGGGAIEVDIKKLGFQECKGLLDRLLHDAEVENEDFLLKIRDRIDAVGIQLPTIEVRFEKLNIEAEALVGSRASPTFLNFFISICEGFLNFLHIFPRRKQKVAILKDASGIIKPSRMTLLLGPPRSGKTSLLLALTGKLDPNLNFSGRVTYNGHGMNEFVPQRTAAYVSQHDLHIGEMTVRETLNYAARFQGVGHRYEVFANLLRREKEAHIKPDPDLDVFMKAIATEGQESSVITDYILKILGLEMCADTMVGNEMLRGISGGQRKRVTTAFQKPAVIFKDSQSGQPGRTGEDIRELTKEVMELVELDPLRQALVGLPGVSGLSSEQRKLLTIAVELVANPSIILMDEPTSGLDARAAAIVMRTIRNTVNTGRTVACTIHQPSIDILEGFDELILLKRGGEEIYVGPLGHRSSHLIKHFEAIDGVPKIKDGYNPASWMLEVTSPGHEMSLGIDFSAIYRNSELYRRNKALIQELSKPAPDSKDLYFPTQYSQEFLTQCIACLWKQHWSYWRNPSYTAVRFLFTIGIALLFGSMFWDLGYKTKKRQDLFDAMGSMFAAVIFLGVQNASSVQPVVAVERIVFYRERAAGMYSTLAYAFAQILIEVPYIFAQAVVYGVIVYAMIGFEWTVEKFFWYLFFMFFTLLYYTYYGMMAVALTPNQAVAAIVSSGFYSLWNLFSGFIIPRPRLPVWWRWYAWLCPVAWTLYGLVASQFGDIQHKLESGEAVEDFLRNFFDFRRDFLGVVASVVVGFATVFALIFVLAIKLFNFQRR